MKVSVIVPAFNEEKYISQCLDSLISQTLKPDEIIVVNNNSTDNTKNIAQKYPVKIINEKNKGVIFAKQAGLCKASGDLVIFFDADSIASPNWINQILKHFSKEDVVAVTGPYKTYDGPEYHKKYLEIMFGIVNLFYSIFKRPIYISGSNIAFRREISQKFNGLDTRKNMGEDEYGIASNLSKYGKIIYDPKIIISTSGRRANGGFLNFFFQILVMYCFNYATSNIFGKSILPPYNDKR